MEKDILIKEAVPEDAEGVLNVLYKTWLATYPNEKIGITVDDVEHSYKDSFLPERIKKNQEKIVNSPSNEKRLVAKYEDEIVGMAMMAKYPDKNQLRGLYVLPEFHGRKVGLGLWNGFKDFIDREKDITVEVADYNERTINFYKKLGFVETGRKWADERFRMKSGNIIPEMEMIIKAHDL